MYVLREDVSFFFYNILLTIEFLVAIMPTMKLITECSQRKESLGKRHTTNLKFSKSNNLTNFAVINSKCVCVCMVPVVLCDLGNQLKLEPVKHLSLLSRQLESYQSKR